MWQIVNLRINTSVFPRAGIFSFQHYRLRDSFERELNHTSLFLSLLRTHLVCVFLTLGYDVIVTKESLRRLIKYIHFWRCIIPVSLNCTTPTHPLPRPDLVSKKREYFQRLSYTAQGWPQWDKV